MTSNSTTNGRAPEMPVFQLLTPVDIRSFLQYLRLTVNITKSAKWNGGVRIADEDWRIRITDVNYASSVNTYGIEFSGVCINDVWQNMVQALRGRTMIYQPYAESDFWGKVIMVIPFPDNLYYNAEEKITNSHMVVTTYSAFDIYGQNIPNKAGAKGAI